MVTIAILAAVLLALGTFVALYVQSFGRSTPAESRRPVLEPAIRRPAPRFENFRQWSAPMRMIRVADAFEPDTAPIWETLVPALEFVRGRGQVHLEELWPAYQQMEQTYPELFEGSSFQGWIALLEESGLVCRVADLVVITERGAEFLRCRVPAGAPTER